jgi:hypothetical protein
VKIPVWYDRSIFEAITEIAKYNWVMGKKILIVTLTKDQNDKVIKECAEMMGNYRDGRTMAGRWYREAIKPTKIRTVRVVETDFGPVEIKVEDLCSK